ncbi:hypothetical protein CYMTET_20718 [Cymbomonas tetramitiformis]|uniref:A-kinase anchor protein 7-like phosphoesterase domain-containing protein n=1 Tax=Cymbomonas tetramitiformis TaxID=36881 RepID=A0AAE0G3G8_9CHLO|nr:hypothetical protein CYMTET_20718 [Cymbomonas tetramitiformis]
MCWFGYVGGSVVQWCVMLMAMMYPNFGAKSSEVCYVSDFTLGCKKPRSDLCFEPWIVGKAQDERPVKLHATVINTRLRLRPSQEEKQERASFDARRLLEMDIDLGECHLNAIHLSQRGVFDASGYYHCVSQVKLP